MSAPAIRLQRVSRSEDTLRYEFTSTLDLFRRGHFMVQYEGLSPDAPESVLSVPFAALAAPIAMAAGAELSVPSLDAGFASSIEACNGYWRRFFPKWRHGAFRLKTKQAAASAPAKNGSAVLFSSGLDSISTYLDIRGQKPHLFCILGADIPISYKHFIAECREKLFDDFAKKEGVGITYIHTDVRDVVSLQKLERYAQSWYSHVQFGLLYAGLTAPVSFGRFSKVFMASCSHRPEEKTPCAADPELVRQLRWGSTVVEDRLHAVSRVEKVERFLKPNPSMLRYLRVCWEQFEKVNCSRCKKCLRTICELLVNNIDPNTANFHVDGRTLPSLRRKMSAYYRLFVGCDLASVNFWREIQRKIDLGKITDLHGSREFFRWLSGFEPLRRNETPVVCSLMRQAERVKRRFSAISTKDSP